MPSSETTRPQVGRFPVVRDGCAEAISTALGEATAESAPIPTQRRKSLEQVLSMLTNGELEMVYQPAIRLDKAEVAFFEALARFHPASDAGPADWFASAAALGLGADLEMLACRCAVGGLQSLPTGSSISINVSPSTILTPEFAAYFASLPLDHVILEVTERDAVACYDELASVLAPLRKNGLRIAVDDAGAGYASLRHVLQIRPDIIKLDISLCRGISGDDMQRALVSALITFSRQVGAALVAEGVETAADLHCLRELGMFIIQGNIAAQPMRLDTLGTEFRSQASGHDHGARHHLAIAA